ncbi:MAG TPA: SpoIIE family protein phosphatase [Terriglobia bacterium]
MAEIADAFFREQLLDRRRRLESAVTRTPAEPRLIQLLGEVDAALGRMEHGTYGICEVCHDTVEPTRLLTDPLVRYCLDHLTAAERSALEFDLEMAATLQRGLLPRPDASHNGWEIAHTYRPFGPVSGDYCDLVIEDGPESDLFFFLGDVSGKGVAASMLTAQLHAIFRALAAQSRDVAQLVAQASRIFCESSLSPYYATLVGGRAGAAGLLELTNAGHCPPLLVQGRSVTRLKPSGTPLGMFCDGDYPVEKLKLNPGDVLVIYTDGLSEARNAEDQEYGEERVTESVRNHRHFGPRGIVEGCLEGLARFMGGASLADDLTVMAIQRAAQG